MNTDTRRRAAPSTVIDTADWEAAAAFLADPVSHGSSEPVTRIETHSSVVFLVGTRAYKLKRPVKFPFLDYSTLALRETACRREIAIDRPIAPEIYIGVEAVTRADDGTLHLGGRGRPIEWVVEMNRFDENATLDRLLEKGPLSHELVDALALAVTRAQARSPVRDVGPWYADLADYVAQNAVAFNARPRLFDGDAAALLERRTMARLAELTELVADRGRLGRVRVGHGDLHCRNIAVIDGRPLLFDAIEFDDRIATGDVLYDAGFLIMDLVDRGDPYAARRFLDRYLIETVRGEIRSNPRVTAEDALLDEISGLAALPVYLSIRAALRAKIAAATATHLTGAARATMEGEARRLFRAACHHLDPCRPHFVAIGGVSGAGKTTLARALAPHFEPIPGAVVLRTDTIRKLIAGVEDTVRLDASHYTPKATARVYDLMFPAASRLLASGRSVITDAVSFRPPERHRLEMIAAANDVPFSGLWLDVDRDTAAARIGTRVGDASDATADVVALQAGRDPGHIDWHRIDASDSPEQTLAAARAAIAADDPILRP